MDMAGHERLVVPIVDLGLELDRAVVADLDEGMALGDGGRRSKTLAG
jgi:hypothetical protein